ncbi:hypothetical protein [uncultured Piscinibacter sp.]|uniref:hypothetical protein n=1 Tax=uncultured Piscinibacter sp. TaxID=1131835 RepID=UPI0026345365|nr:hypothetical protein [uncultured Piscinibacter sp.]
MTPTALRADISPRPESASATHDAEALPLGFALTRANTGGRISVFERGALRIDAEAGAVIRVHAGCLWVPDPAEQCSVGVAAGEQICIGQSGSITTMAIRATQLELVWPERADRRRPVPRSH